MIDVSDASEQRPEDDYARPALFDIKELKRQLSERASTWVPEHFPRGRISADRSEWRTANTHGDAPRGQGSCVLELKGEHAGCIRDWSTDEHGDQLYALECSTGLTGRALFEYAAGLVGATPAKPKANGKGNGHGSTRQSDDEKRAREIAFLRKHCVPAAGTLVETYLAFRGLELPECPDLLFHPSLTDWNEKIGRPAMVTIVRRSESRDETGGVWRTYLADDGSGKADMPTAKMGLGPVAGGVAMLMPMTADGTLGIAEGQETALAASKIFDVPVWAGLSAGGVRSFVFPSGLKKLWIFADRGKDGESAADALCRRALAAGIDASVYLPHGDDDFADDLTRGYSVGDYQPGPPPTAAAEPEIIPPALTAAKAAAAALTRDSGSIAIRQVIEKIALARPGALYEEQFLLLVHDQTGTGKKALNTELRDAKKRQAAARPPQQLQSYNGAPDWRENLIENEWGEPKALMTNVCLALGDQVWDGVLGFNEFTAMIAMRRAAPWIVNETAFEERPWTDADTRMATMWVQGVARIHASSLVVFEGIQTVAEQHPYHPVRNYLDALTHDGSPRIDDLLIRYYGAGGDPPDEADGAEAMEKWRRQYAYYQAVGARFLIGAVARIYQPGCKNDCMPNFVGAQGALKSSSLAALFDPWFTDEIADLGSKDAAMQSAGVWCVEISELAAISRVAIERVKAWLSRQKDRFRPPYGRLIKEQPRQSVAAGTTNVDNFLVDDTGNRRMWSVRCGTIDIDALRADRDQLWAEARDRYRRGEKWWLHESSLIAAAADVQAEFTDDDIWTECVMEYIAKHQLISIPQQSISIPQLLRDCIGIPVQDQTQPHGRRVVSILRRAGWTRKQMRVEGKQVWRYFPHDVTTGHETGDSCGDS
jgi:putative DNA primase/helicase